MIVCDYFMYSVHLRVHPNSRKTLEVLTTSFERAEELAISKHSKPVDILSCTQLYAVDMVDSALYLEVFNNEQVTYLSSQVVLFYTAFTDEGEALDSAMETFRVVYDSKSGLRSVLSETFPHIDKGITEIYNVIESRNELACVEFTLEKVDIIDIIDPNILLEIFNQ